MKGSFFIILLAYFAMIGVVICYGETYKGKAENVATNERGVEFDVVVRDSNNVEVLRRKQWISTGTYSPENIKEAIKIVVERMTQEIWAHIEGAKQAIIDKEEIEAYSVDCSTYVPPSERPGLGSLRSAEVLESLDK